MQGGSDTTFTAEASLSQTTVRKAWSRPPISIDFQVLMFTASGLLVRFLKVFEKSNYQSVKVSRFSDGRIIRSLLFWGALITSAFDLSHVQWVRCKSQPGGGELRVLVVAVDPSWFCKLTRRPDKGKRLLLDPGQCFTASLAPVHVH